MKVGQLHLAREVYGCTDMGADNYDPHATHLEDGDMPTEGHGMVPFVQYSSFNNTLGFVADALPEGQLDYYGMPMNLSTQIRICTTIVCLSVDGQDTVMIRSRILATFGFNFQKIFLL